MSVIKANLHRVVPHWFDPRDADRGLAGLQRLLPGPVAPHLSRGREDPEKLGGELVLSFVSEGDFKPALAAGIVQAGDLMLTHRVHGAARLSNKVSMSACAVNDRARAMSERLSKGPR